MESTNRGQLQKALDILQQNKGHWAITAIDQRLGLLDETARTTEAVAEQWVRAACQAKGIDFDSPRAGEEWMAGPVTVLRNVRLLRQSLREIKRDGSPTLDQSKVRTRSDGQLAVEVFPRDLYERVLYSGFRAEIWMEPGVDRDRLRDTMATAYKGQPQQSDGKVALVLGAGNVASIGPMDVLHRLFIDSHVCVLKMNPVNAYLGPFLERAFSPLVDQDVLRVVYGEAAEGDFLVQHEYVDEIHITGSDRVHDIIVWGKPGEEQQRARAANKPRITKPITSELGCVTPVVIVPGQWSDQELEFQAANVATMVANNASFNCNAAKLLVTSRGWPQRKEFLRRVERVLSSLPPREAYYPGSHQKYASFVEAHPEARPLTKRINGSLPWTTIFDVDPGSSGDIVFKQEAWCGILAETALSATDATDFLQEAVRFCNDHVWGTLSCVLLVDPQTQQQLGDRLDQAIGDLRYGSIAVNHWAALSYAFGTTVWGAFPGHTLEDIGSGRGFVHNTLMFDHPQKSVIYGPFTAFPKPPWFATHRSSHKVGRQLTRFEANPSLLKVLGVAYHALRG